MSRASKGSADRREDGGQLSMRLAGSTRSEREVACPEEAKRKVPFFSSIFNRSSSPLPLALSPIFASLLSEACSCSGSLRRLRPGFLPALEPSVAVEFVGDTTDEDEGETPEVTQREDGTASRAAFEFARRGWRSAEGADGPDIEEVDLPASGKLVEVVVAGKDIVLTSSPVSSSESAERQESIVVLVAASDTAAKDWVSMQLGTLSLELLLLSSLPDDFCVCEAARPGRGGSWLRSHVLPARWPKLSLGVPSCERQPVSTLLPCVPLKALKALLALD
mmetsp:Transcript_27566/g.49908  ORF Transcript_27566/g.49908 Transcript_27566/m.49908 type:complete len:278 (-) Transcript_27566:149-982(-)|eukprot:CAMPEP_0197656506 /NCGR_PEP_ID=MMETSP1338-20131121/42143_1 /TAXON_ID=43686 ORGANISM="Pelagodinium beii, Strain RCC1491" /NCGR_SAMPLE_ID=MMETSP1338 /ASSEMBLY_ACC=CAM_ASM_000754 /LENGTH=277 /DNA_ID=CAMNT_0043232531 /DNA_START=355 /DNA_END=1188 /DNA_ORIENTATION=+